MNDTGKTRQLIARRLVLARQQAGLSQGQVAKIMGFHRPTISEIEAGRRRVIAEELARLADIYGVKVSWLMGTEAGDDTDDRVSLAARELAKLQNDDLDRVLNLLKTLRAESRGSSDSGT